MTTASRKRRGARAATGAVLLPPFLSHNSVELPIRIVSEANAREHWRTKHRRAASQKLWVRSWLDPEAKHNAKPSLPCVITLTRIAPRRFDGDNLQRGFKAVRDQVAAWLGIDDGSALITWEYRQGRGAPHTYGVRIEWRDA